MPAMWIVIIGIALYMIFFSIDNLPATNNKDLLIAGWFAVIILSGWQGLSLWRQSRRKPTAREKTDEFHIRMRRASARKRQRRQLI